ncbi:MAG: alpha/beta hydrolase, partial [Betaproteobacteria bacterium]|nr:alpha/beta hydrolase [Betaproteobacteria bacterium]
MILAAGAPVCGVDVNYIKYTTVGAMGEATDATAALMVPTGSDPRCTGPRPIVLYAHGTVPHKKYNLANWTDRNNPAFDESVFIAASFAAQGYILVAPNYAGYDSSSLSY